MTEAPNEFDERGFAKGVRPLCPFCSRPWSDAMSNMLEDCSTSTGYYGECDGVELVIDITCDGCERTIYRKEIQDARGGDRYSW